MSTRSRPGRLKIFLGMCPGVGKTHAMLQDAQARWMEGVEVLIGSIGTHVCPDLLALAEGLPALAAYDVDGVLASRPELVLIDDLQQPNPAGARHHKRCLDLRELLAAGIDVYTSFDVYHVESRSDAVGQIVGTAIRNTVPDWILERADEIEVIELPPDEMLKRLSDGNVPSGEVLERFFRKGNLTALREMALRVTADHVDRQMRDYMRVEQIVGPWKSSERLMVAVNHSALSERLIRHARRIAFDQNTYWMVVHVETGSSLEQRSRAGIERNLALARELGAEVFTTTDGSVVNGLLRVAQQHNITQIVIGRSHRSLLRRWLGGGGLAAQLIDRSGMIDVYVSGGEDLNSSPPQWLTAMFRSSAAEYMRALGTMLAVVLAGELIFRVIQFDDSVMLLVYLLTVLLLAMRFARGPVLAAAALSSAALSFLFIPPYYTLKLESISGWILFTLYFIIAAVIGVLTTRLRNGAVRLRQSELQALAAFEFASVMSRAVNMDDVCRAAIERLSTIFDARVRVLLPDANGGLYVAVSEADGAVNESELGVALWAFRHEQPAGRFTETLSTAAAMHVPMLTAHGAVGVVSVAMRERLSTPQADLLRGLVSQIALAVEREQLDERAEQSNVLKESERLSKTLLNLISHELRTPITAIVGAAGSLNEPEVDADDATRRQLHRSIRTSAERLDTLVENLLDMTRLESGTLRLNTDWTDVADLVRTVRERVADELAGHEFVVEVQDDLPLVRMDVVLMQQVLYNLLHNAALYTPKGTRVRLIAQRERCPQQSMDDLVLTVMDRGPGLAPDDLARAFDKFHRVNHMATTGLGLGLSICKGLVEVHGGTITAENRRSGGLRMMIRLSIEPMPAVPEVHDE